MITFTGSVATGRAIRASAGLKKVTLELGGNCAVILEPDAKLDTAVSRIVQGGYGFSGQICISVQRVYVDESIANEFSENLVSSVRNLRVGHPREESTQIASMIGQDAAERVERWTREAIVAGAKMLCVDGNKEDDMLPSGISFRAASDMHAVRAHRTDR